MIANKGRTKTSDLSGNLAGSCYRNITSWAVAESVRPCTDCRGFYPVVLWCKWLSYESYIYTNLQRRNCVRGIMVAFGTNLDVVHHHIKQNCRNCQDSVPVVSLSVDYITSILWATQSSKDFSSVLFNHWRMFFCNLSVTLSANSSDGNAHALPWDVATIYRLVVYSSSIAQIEGTGTAIQVLVLHVDA